MTVGGFLVELVFWLRGLYLIVSLKSIESSVKELEPIINYKMDPTESKAYKLSLIWQEECQKEIPNENFIKLKRKSDPRKSILFKYCYKLSKEMKGILSDKDLHLYVRAQIQTLKWINNGEIHALIGPHCLVGDKAWKRWKIWKKKYDKISNSPSNVNDISIKATESKIKAELLSSLKFIQKNKLNNFCILKNKKEEINRWIKTGELSCFYVVLSPWIKEIFNNYDLIDFDYVYYRCCITPNIESFFKEIFSKEFSCQNQ